MGHILPMSDFEEQLSVSFGTFQKPRLPGESQQGLGEYSPLTVSNLAVRKMSDHQNERTRSTRPGKCTSAPVYENINHKIAPCQDVRIHAWDHIIGTDVTPTVCRSHRLFLSAAQSAITIHNPSLKQIQSATLHLLHERRDKPANNHERPTPLSALSPDTSRTRHPIVRIHLKRNTSTLHLSLGSSQLRYHNTPNKYDCTHSCLS